MAPRQNDSKDLGIADIVFEEISNLKKLHHFTTGPEGSTEQLSPPTSVCQFLGQLMKEFSYLFFGATSGVDFDLKPTLID